MRNLQDWEGCHVLMCGTVLRWERDENRDVRYLLGNVEVRKWGCSDIRKFDHLWVFHPEKIDVIKSDTAPERCLRLDRVSGVHRVTSYRRKDGTKDYSLHLIPSITPLTEEEIKQAAKTNSSDLEEFIDYLEKLVSAFATQNVNLTIYSNEKELEKWYSLWLTKLKRDREVRKKYVIPNTSNRKNRRASKKKGRKAFNIL